MSATIATDIAAATAAFAAGLSSVTEAIRTAAQSPADQVRLLSELANFYVAPNASTAPIAGAVATMETATAALCRRSALVSLCVACSNYQPYSFQDATGLLTNVVALLDAEMLVAADGGDLNTWQAFRILRTAVVLDLTERAAQLPEQVTITTGVPLPSLAIAYQLYRDASRSDDLIARVDPVHPAWMPVEFEALNS